MTEITVLYFGLLRELVPGKKRQDRIAIEDSSTLDALTQKLAELHGQKFKEYIFDTSGRLRSGLAFAVDGDSIDPSRLKKIKCAGIKEFVILPPISGGA